jgi:hypothetical protein
MRAAVVHGMISPSDRKRTIDADTPAILKVSCLQALPKKLTNRNVCNARQVALQAHASFYEICSS